MVLAASGASLTSCRIAAVGGFGVRHRTRSFADASATAKASKEVQSLMTAFMKQEVFDCCCETCLAFCISPLLFLSSTATKPHKMSLQVISRRRMEHVSPLVDDGQRQDRSYSRPDSRLLAYSPIRKVMKLPPVAAFGARAE